MTPALKKMDPFLNGVFIPQYFIIYGILNVRIKLKVKCANLQHLLTLDGSHYNLLIKLYTPY